MSSNVEDALNDLDRTIASILNCLEQGKAISLSRTDRRMGFDVTTNIRISSLESFGKHVIGKPREESLVDVLEYDDAIKIIALIPGIRKEDILTTIGDGFIEITITNDKKSFIRKISCNIKPRQIVAKSLSYNNSVVEIVFKKGGK